MPSLRIVAGSVGGRLIDSPPGQDLRPMMEKVRAALFDMLWHFDAIHGRVLDLYAGSGAVGLEALSRGASQADFVEWNAVSAKTIRDNLRTLGFTDVGRVHRLKVEEVLAQPARLGDAGPYDLISMTPPYQEADYPTLLDQLARSTLVAEGSVVVVEHPRRVELPDGCGPLARFRERKYGKTILSIYDYPFAEPPDEMEPST